ncbi:F-box domain-containing protein [Mycena venus]|uniref:F-box domain-containing protein n=1 Tax=Mycena venus TaxID=2733690 RepID=A0A8H6TZ37_9AGAR|nr:F-box domain-containing protein [Mycena venus]
MNPLLGAQCTECGGPLPNNDSQEEQILLDMNGLPDSRYRELLNSNEPPLDIEAASIEPLVAHLRRRLSRYDDKISRLRAQLERLEQERATAESDLSKNSAIVSPLRRMPAEILFEIFTLTLPSDREVLERGAIDVGDSPWSLTQICGRWRMLALASSSLWSFFGIDCTIRYDTAAAYPMPLLIAQLQRAKHLRVNFLASSPSQYQLGLLQLLSLYSHRWEELYLYVIPEILPIIDTLPPLYSCLAHVEAGMA